MKYLIPVIFIAFIVSSCGKYENGPNFTLLSKKARVVNTWKLEGVFWDGDPISINSTSTNNSYIFKKNFDYQIIGEANQNQPAEQNGTWKFGDDKETVIIDLDGSSDTMTISRLKNKSLWLEREMSGGSVVLYKYVAE